MSEKICNYMKMMKEFHNAFCVPISTFPKLLSPEDTIRRLTLITSEVGELGDALRTKDLAEIADALGDILYVTFGCAVEMGLPMDRIFNDIHQSNMSKIWSDGEIHKDKGGKVLKPPTFTPVDLTWLRGL
jgi:predicted HAD superfamily Cof-like phosphohydrolase